MEIGAVIAFALRGQGRESHLTGWELDTLKLGRKSGRNNNK